MLNFQFIDATNTTLFHLSAQAYGDATQWPKIAQANGLSDPSIKGLTRLIIPLGASAGAAA